MPKAAPYQAAFNGGELSEYIAGRPDVAKYAVGCRQMSGWIPLVEGPAITRPGTQFVAEVKNSAHRTWLVRFEFSQTDSYMLEFGDKYVRFYFSRAQVQVSGVAAWATSTAYVAGDIRSNGGVNYYCTTAHTSGTFATDLAAGKWYALTGTIFEIPTPYAVADLTNSDGTFALRYVQTGDVVYLAHGSYAVRKLSRLGATNWTLAEVDFQPPPFQDENTTATTVYSDVKTGACTLTASANLFTSAHVGQYFFLREKSVRDINKWQPGGSYTAGNFVRYDGRNYKALNTATAGVSPPIHTEGSEYDGGVQWEFQDPGYGWVKITGFSSATVVTGTVVSQLPDGAVTAGKATKRWAFQAWNSTDGYPTSVTFFRERLTFARDETIWLSVAGDFENFATEIDGQITSDAGFERTLASDRVNSIRWMSPGDVLLVGTHGDEWAITESTTSDPFGPANVKTKRQSTYGSSQVQPQRIGNETLFVQKAGRKVRAMGFRFEEDGFESPNVAAFHRTITKTGIVDTAFQQEPWSILWCARTDGLLIGLTLDREQDVVAWHRHPFSGGAVETVECIPSPDGGQDDPWLIVKYTVSGATKRYIAHMATAAEIGDAQSSWKYADMLLTYSGAPATTISGLGHLEGKEIWVLVDGARHPNRTVSGGSITLQLAGSVVQVGLPSPATLETMALDGGNPIGTSQGRTRRSHVMTLRVLNSLGGIAGPTENELGEIRYRSPSVPMGSAPPPFTGDLELEWPGDYTTEERVVVVKDRPMPMTLVAIMPQGEVQTGR
jgi:hypothetical protein